MLLLSQSGGALVLGITATFMLVAVLEGMFDGKSSGANTRQQPRQMGRFRNPDVNKMEGNTTQESVSDEIDIVERCKPFQAEFAAPRRRYTADERSKMKVKRPPMLLTTPGSGNTWVRQLLEIATGVETGSVYHDDRIAQFMPGEHRCEETQVAIKGHPFINTELNALLYNKTNHCRASPFDSVATVLRDPIAAAWSTALLSITGSHTGYIEDLAEERLPQIRVELTRGVRIWTEQFSRCLEPFETKRGPGSVFYGVYDRLTNKSARVKELGDLVEFITGDRPSDDKLACTYDYVERRDWFHRPHHPNVLSVQTAMDAIPGLECSLRKTVMHEAAKHNISFPQTALCP